MKAELTQRGVVSVCLRGGGCGQYCKLVFGQLEHFFIRTIGVVSLCVLYNN